MLKAIHITISNTFYKGYLLNINLYCRLCTLLCLTYRGEKAIDVFKCKEKTYLLYMSAVDKVFIILDFSTTLLSINMEFLLLSEKLIRQTQARLSHMLHHLKELLSFTQTSTAVQKTPSDQFTIRVKH